MRPSSAGWLQQRGFFELKKLARRCRTQYDFLMQLFWCTTVDHDEDWFVVAPSAAVACDYFEAYDGYEPGSATAEHVLDVPTDVAVRLEEGAQARWADDALLIACGGEKIAYQPDPSPEAAALRAVMGVLTGAWRFNGKPYVSGDITLGAVGAVPGSRN